MQAHESAPKRKAMNTFAAYVFRQALGPLLAILGALAAIAILTQGLNQLDLIVANREAGLAFAWVTFLAVPQLVSLILPLAVFFAVAYALNRMQTESEVAVVYGAGVSRRRIARPIMQLAVLAALGHLAINCVIQPWALKGRRETLYAVRTDVASSLVREGAFTFPSDDLTIYARERGGGGQMRDIMIDDARGSRPLTYTARTGAVAMIDGKPAMVMRDGQIQRMREDGVVEVLDFDRHTVPLGDFFEDDETFVLKESDRTLFELFFPDLTSHYEQRNVARYLAEGHARLSSPLLNIALAMIALAGALVGEFSRRGYMRRLMIAAGAALIVRLAAIALQAAAIDEPSLNPLQYALPLGAAFIANVMIGQRAGRIKRRDVAMAIAVRA
jgi:lipopolysaccharide export system permease protein